MVTIVPVVGSLFSSFKSQTEIIAEPLNLPSRLLFENYERAWDGTNLGEPLILFARNSVIATSVGVVLGVGAGVFAGYAIARSRTRFGGLLNRYFVLLITLPFIVTWIPLFVLSDRLGVLSNPLALGVMYAARLIPFAAVMMRAYFTSFPLDLIEAAHIDGASEFTAFQRIVLPLSWGGVLAVGLVQVIFIWNELGLGQVLLLSPDSRTLPVGLTQFRGQYGSDYGALFASLMLTISPIIVLYTFTERKLTEGLRIGAMK
ncbi:MAG: carbohydrate ABC transporter permease [bacterium]|nr:carbohydrate ABC transporter permease [bacterium]